MQKQRIILIIGIILALASLVIVKVYIDQRTQAANEAAKTRIENFKVDFQQSQISVLVAKADIPKGKTIEAEDLDIAIIPREYVVPQAAYSLDRIAGMVTIAPFSAKEQISLSKLAPARQAGGLAEITPVGKRAVTITVEFTSLLGMLKPNDYVDVSALVIVPVQTPQGQQNQPALIPLFQNVLVLAIGQDIGGPAAKEESRYKQEEKPAEPPSMITLALSPQEANIIAFVQEQGKIRLTLRSPADSQIQPTQPASWDTIFQYLLSGAASPEQPQEPLSVELPKEEPKAKGDVVEVYRGLNKETVTYSK